MMFTNINGGYITCIQSYVKLGNPENNTGIIGIKKEG